MTREQDGRLSQQGNDRYTGWFIVGGLAVLLAVGAWLVSGGVFDNTPTGSIAPASQNSADELSAQ